MSTALGAKPEGMLPCQLAPLPKPLLDLFEHAAMTYGERLIKQPDLTATNYIVESQPPRNLGGPGHFVCRATYSAKFGREKDAHAEHWQVVVQGRHVRDEDIDPPARTMKVLSVELYVWSAGRKGWELIADDIPLSGETRPASQAGDQWPSQTGW